MVCVSLTTSSMKDFTFTIHDSEKTYNITVQAETDDEAKKIARDKLYDEYVKSEKLKMEK